MMKIGIIGAGKVGIAIGYVMKNRGLHVVAISDIEKASLDVARHYLGDDCLYTGDNKEVVKKSDVIAVTTQDRAISHVGKELSEHVTTLKNKLFFHTSGAHSSKELSPLDEKGALLGSLHPLQTFPDINSAINALPSTYIFIEGDEEALYQLELLGTYIGYKVLTIDARSKALYHLSAVFVCNLLCALLYASEGVMDRIHIKLEPFFPIIHATLKNIENKGPLMSLTGPVVRGDVETVASHIRAMDDMEQHRKVYKALSSVALDMVKERKILDENVLERLKKILEEI